MADDVLMCEARPARITSSENPGEAGGDAAAEPTASEETKHTMM